VNDRQLVRWQRLGFWLLIALIAAFLLLPFYWAVNTSLKTEPQLRMTPGTLIPRDPDTGGISVSFQSYRRVLQNEDFVRSLRNSAIVATGTTAFALAIGSLAGFALGKLHFRGRSTTLTAILSMSMFPQIVVLTSLFAIIRTLDAPAIWSMIVSYQLFALPFTVWILTAFFHGLPNELFEAARVDGATPLQAFRHVLAPLSTPALLTAGIFAFLAALNEYLFALTFTVFDNRSRTVPIEIAFMGPTGGPNLASADAMAAAVIVSLPMMTLALIFQRRIVDGLTTISTRPSR